MTKDDEHGPDAVVKRCQHAYDHAIVGSENGMVAALNALQPDDILPNDLVVCQGWQPIETVAQIEWGNSQEIDFWCGEFGRMTNCRPATSSGWLDGKDDYIPDHWVTHWRYSPAPPNQGALP